MTTIVHLAGYLTLAALGWFALVLAVGTVVNGWSWVWVQTREAVAQIAWRARHGAFLPQRLPPRDEPVSFMPRGGWL